MICANLATYPPRRSNLLRVVKSVSPQVDRLNVVLNQFSSPLRELQRFENVRQIIPDEDTKDAGKFYPDVSGADFVLLIDDDLIFPEDFVAQSVASLKALGPGYMGGYHGSVYERPRPAFSLRALRRWLLYSAGRIADNRRILRFYEGLEHPVLVDQIATNTAIMRGCDLPPFEFMRDSQKFVDVRLARWCFEQGIRPVCLPRTSGWLGEVRFEETIYRGFTRRNPPHVAKEIWSYAFKIEGSGKELRA